MSTSVLLASILSRRAKEEDETNKRARNGGCEDSNPVGFLLLGEDHELQESHPEDQDACHECNGSLSNSTTTNADLFGQLPEELQLHIFTFLKEKDLLTFSLASHRTRSLVEDNSVPNPPPQTHFIYILQSLQTVCVCVCVVCSV